MRDFANFVLERRRKQAAAQAPIRLGRRVGAPPRQIHLG
ncbi:MAG TPA: hypothetical protein VM163_11165 [bacterium]|nr:hypothetical protein [bacterium]